MNTRALTKQARRLSDKLQPRPRIIHCAGEVAALFASLEYQIQQEGGDINAPVEWSEEEKAFMDEFSALLEAQVREIERCCNVRLVD